MKSKNPIFLVSGVIVIICTGLWFYVEWDLKRFRESLPSIRQGTYGSQAELLENDTHSEETVNGTQPVLPLKLNTQPIVPDLPTPERESPIASTDTDLFFDRDQQISEKPLTPDVSDADVSDAAPYDIQIVKEGFEDYNTHLHTNPAYAYQRLDDAFREQFGDDPDVDILVESVKCYNDGPVPVDTAISFMEAELRLISKLGFPVPIAELQDSLEMLRESKQYALESGDEVLYRSNFRFEPE